MSANHSLIGLQPLPPPSEVDKLNIALDALQPAPSELKIDLFQKAYPSIMSAKSRKVPMKDILAALEKFNLKLHPQKLREMMKEEEKRRAEHGDVPCCRQCGQILQGIAAADGALSERGDNA